MSFVIQNYSKYTLFLIKTRRYHLHIRFRSILVLSYFLKFISIYFSWVTKSFVSSSDTHSLFSRFFVGTTYTFFKKILFKKFGLYTNLQTKSLITHILFSLNKINFNFLLFGVRHANITSSSFHYSAKYLLPISISHMSFKQKNYNIFVFYIMYILVSLYNVNIFSISNNFTLYTHIQTWFFFFKFPRKYFFKVHSY